MWDSGKREAEYFEQRGLPVPGPRFHQQVLHGLSLPLHLARALFADPAARGRYLRVCVLQFLVILGLGLFFMKSGQEVAYTAQGRATARTFPPPLPPLPLDAVAEELDDTRSDAEPRPAHKALAAVARAAGLDVEVRVNPEQQARAEAKARLERAKAAWVEAGNRLARVKALEGVPTPLSELEQARDEAVAAHRQAKQAQAEAQAALIRARRVRDEERTRRLLHEVRWREFTVTDLEFWAALLAAMHFVQWVVIALSRDYHNAIGRDVSLLTGLEPEDAPQEPRVRLNLQWLGTKMKRRWRALVLFFIGMPLLWLVTLGMPFRSPLLPVLTFAWTAWWFVVFAASKSARAWSDEAVRPPWFVRAWTWLTTRVPGFRWAVPRAYGRFLETQSRFILSPMARVEQQPWAFTGLALMRTVGLIPGLKCFVRPLIPVAAAHLLEAHRVALPALPAPVSLPTPAAAPAPTPAQVASAP